MKLTPSILTASVARGSSDSREASLFSAASLARASSLSSLSSGSSLSSASSLSSVSSGSSLSSDSSLSSASSVSSASSASSASSVSSASSLSSLSSLSRTSSLSSAEIQRERTAFLERYNPQVCRHMALDADRCFCGCAPALEVVRRRYGTQTAVAWVTIQLSETARLWGSSDKIPGEMLEAVAESFVGEYSKLNLAEIGLYLSRLRAGVYGKVAYGKLTPDHLVSNLPTFLAQRSKEIEVYRRNAEREERDRERQRWAARAVSHEVATRMYEEALKHCNNNPQRAIEYLKGLRNYTLEIRR